MSRAVCRCGHLAELHAGGFACVLHYQGWTHNISHRMSDRCACRRFRKAWWVDEHSPTRHVLGRAWLALPRRARWVIADRWWKAHPERCWCDVVDAIYATADGSDFDPCDVPLPWGAGTRSPGRCYCPPVEADS